MTDETETTENECWDCGETPASECSQCDSGEEYCASCMRDHIALEHDSDDD